VELSLGAWKSFKEKIESILLCFQLLLFSIYETWSRPPDLDPDTAVDKMNQNTANIMYSQTEADD
jgi:hypothetical protein